MRTRPIDPDDANRFIELAWTLHAGDPLWVPPIRQSLRKELASGSALDRYAKLRMFLCERDGRDVGRVAAIVNPRLTGEGGAPLGQVGYFESVDDPEVARSLFEAAASWLRGEGARQVIGPMNGGAHRLHRLMVSGFDRTPFLFEPRNPPYYVRLFEGQGFAPVARWSSYDVTAEIVAPLADRVAAVARRARQTGRYCGRHLDPRDPETLTTLHRLLDEVWRGHVGYAPLDLVEFTEVIGPLLAIIDQRHVGVVCDGAEVHQGLAFMVPDYVDEVRALDGDGAGWGAWLKEGTLPRRLVLHTVALLPGSRRKGASALLNDAGLQNIREDGYEAAVIALVTSDWKLFGRALPATRDYALFGRAL